MSMVEKVARVIDAGAFDATTLTLPSWDKRREAIMFTRQERAFSLARAAIEVMREPTLPMKRKLADVTGVGYDISSEAYVQAIDAALSEKEE